LREIIITSDGSHTIYVPELNEHYHSVHGAVQESEYIFIERGFNECKSDPVSVLEVGFGTGLNVLLTALKSIETNRIVYYTSVEKYPLEKTITDLLNYHMFTGLRGKEIFSLIHAAEWNKCVEIVKNFYLTKTESDLTTDKPTGEYDIIYFDAFGPDKQPEMWTYDIFSAISAVTVKNGILVTYSAKGEVKRILKSCGFEVSLIPGPPGKRQIIRAVKI
jgi:tRNA U34 5-methylaminomethyl-2-thiouridine-forming methyltransferase MnmC